SPGRRRANARKGRPFRVIRLGSPPNRDAHWVRTAWFETWERQSPDWRFAVRQSGDWRSQAYRVPWGLVFARAKLKPHRLKPALREDFRHQRNHAPRDR